MVLGLGARALGRVLVRQVYCAPEQTARRLQQAAEEFRRFTVNGSINSADAMRIGRWNREHPDVTLTVYANGTILTSTGRSAELIGAENGLVIRTPEREQSEGLIFPVTFADGTYQVVFQEESARAAVPGGESLRRWPGRRAVFAAGADLQQPDDPAH